MQRSSKGKRQRLPFLFWFGALVCLALAGLVGRYLLDWNGYERGRAARLRLDCYEAVQSFNEVTGVWRPPFLDDFSQLAAAEQAECAAYLFGLDHENANQWQAAIAGYQEFLNYYPDSPLSVPARKRLENVTFLHAVQLEQEGQIEDARRAYEEFLFQYPNGEQAAQARERIHMLVYLEAVANEQAGNGAGALLKYQAFLKYNLEHDLVSSARQRMAGLLLSTRPDQLANETVCERVEKLVEDARLPEDSPVLPGLYLACGAMYERVGQPHAAFDMLAAALMTGPDSAPAQVALQSLAGNDFACENALALRSNPMFAGQRDFLSGLLISCAGTLGQQGDLAGAQRLYDQFLADFPDDPRAAQVQRAVVDLMIQQARSAGASEIPAPIRTGDVESGTARVVIQNDSPEPLRLIIAGPETRMEEIDACVNCPSFPSQAPEACLELGPTVTYELAPGAYDVLVEALTGEAVRPFVGSWTLESGAYYTCFFIVDHAD